MIGMKAIAACIAGMAALAGCGKAAEEAPANSTQAAALPAVAPSKPAFTKSDWKRTLESAYESSSKETDASGITKFMACFEKKDAGKCETVAFGREDAFNKLSRFTPGYTQLNNVADIYTNVKLHVVALECQEPRVVIAPVYNSKNGWLFVKKFAVMADGELVLEKDFETGDVKRDNGYGWVNEVATSIATSGDVDALRKISKSGALIVRISGDKGYVTLDKARAKEFGKDAADSLIYMDKISSALLSGGGPECRS